ncbi:MAG TPA: GAF domain-containing sensor histidine kinase [Candidatus Limnocylindria bacterium]|nr:GAF domain-containing sensor histidine kinase [Candidatus Limnocylindria bacterium]
MRIGNAASPEELFELVFEAAHEAVGYDTTSLMMADPAGDALIVRASRPTRLEGTRVPVGPSISWQALERREPLVLEGPAQKELGTAYTKDVPFAICLPLIVGAKTQGVLNVNRSAHPGADAIAFLRILADQAAVAIERMELYSDLQHFTGQLLSQEEEHRRRLARDLHDGLAPILVSAYAQLQSAGVDNEQVRKATDLLRRAIRETREILGTVRPATLDDLGLVAALSAAAREMAAEAGWTLEEALDDPGPLSREAESTLYRVAVEALNNVKKHAAAHEVRLALLKAEDTLEIDVADDGHGFETEQWGEAGIRPGHFGLLGMRERVAFLGGLCKVQSKPGEGTTVRIVVPRERLR